MTVEYDKNDESEIVIKTLMFGPNIRVIEPSDVIEKISTRISKQDKLFKSYEKNYYYNYYCKKIYACISFCNSLLNLH